MNMICFGMHQSQEGRSSVCGSFKMMFPCTVLLQVKQDRVMDRHVIAAPVACKGLSIQTAHDNLVARHGVDARGSSSVTRRLREASLRRSHRLSHLTGIAQRVHDADEAILGARAESCFFSVRQLVRLNHVPLTIVSRHST
jgi:hypothetical protein